MWGRVDGRCGSGGSGGVVVFSCCSVIAVIVVSWCDHILWKQRLDMFRWMLTVVVSHH